MSEQPTHEETAVVAEGTSLPLFHQIGRAHV